MSLRGLSAYVSRWAATLSNPKISNAVSCVCPCHPARDILCPLVSKLRWGGYVNHHDELHFLQMHQQLSVPAIVVCFIFKVF